MPRRRGAAGREAAEWTFHVGYGSLCLDLANTASWRGSGQPVERLPAYQDLVRWSRQAGVVTEAEARALLREAARHPEEAARALGDALTLREALYRIFAGLAAGRAPIPADLDRLNSWIGDALGRLRVELAGARFAWRWAGATQALDRMLWPVARAAAELLTSGDLRRLRTCASPNCRWVFLDTTRNRSRRWCMMAVCGNRAKVRRYQRRRNERA